MKIEDFFSEKSGLDSLKKELEVENSFWMKLVDTIPAKMYFEHNIQERITADRHLAMNQAAEDLKRQSCNHIELSSKGKHKRARLDPFNQKSVTQIHDEMNKKKRKKKRKGSVNPSASLTRATNIEELQKRLQERISLFQAQRNSVKNNPTAEKRLKSKVKKLKRKENVLKAKELSRIEKQLPEKKQEDNKPTFNKDSNILYSKFDFSENGEEDSAKKNEFSGKKVKTLLKKAEKNKEKIENLKNVDPEKAELISTKEKWKKAILKTEGVKVRDDPALLKKSLKKEEKKKKKSAKVWKERNEEVDKKKKARQDKRNKNLMKRKKDKLDHKLKLARKKGRIIPSSK